MSDSQYILCLNSGSSSIKYSLYRMGREDETLLARGAGERIGLGGGRVWVRTGSRASVFEQARDLADHRVAVQWAFGRLHELRLAEPTAVGHRLVHGGGLHVQPEIIDPALLADLKRLIPFAPLHLPSQIDGIESVTERYPALKQVACFDTAFHARMPELARRFPLPEKFWAEGVRRYGFHGLSFEYVLHALHAAPDDRIVIAHLGSGASLAAVHNGRPVDTTMGLTPAGGFMMGTRSGDLDPGALLYLMNEKGYSTAQIEDLVNRRSGLLGVSGSTSDMQTLLASRRADGRAALAVDMFCYHVRKHIGSMSAALGGLDTLAFTGGIGENAAQVRSEICSRLGYLGIRLDEGRNAIHADPISLPASACAVRVIRTDEDAVIARQVFGLLGR